MSGEGRIIVKARGLPWSASADEVVEFFSEVAIVGGVDGVHFGKNREGRPSGEAFIEVETKEDVERALEKHKCNMGKRYVEVFESEEDALDYACNIRANSQSQGRGGMGGGFGGDFEDDAVVKLRGLPYDATQMQVQEFFRGLQIEDNGILLATDFNGRPSGEAYVQFTNVGDGKKALTKNKENMGHRYIEVFSSSMNEAKAAQQNMQGRGFGPMRGGPGGPGPMMRGPGPRGGPMMRPGPYDRQRMGGMGGYGGGMGGRGDRNFSDDFFGGFSGGPGPNMRGGMGGGGGGGGMFNVHMRGLPFRVTEHEIAEWFSSVADPVDVVIHFNNDGRPSGEADVSFASDGDARRAMQKDKQHMQHRYVELFYR